MGRRTREPRRAALNIAELNAGDFVMLAACGVLFLALILNWWVGGDTDNAVWKSSGYFILMLLLILATVVLAIYPLLQSESSLPRLPFATPPMFIAIGFVIFLSTLYEFGRYTGVLQHTVSPGFGIYLALVCGLLYLVGALIKWGSRERRIRAQDLGSTQ